MSGEKPTGNNSDSHVTTKDLFGSIPKPIDVDPFEGIDMESINVLRRPVVKGEEGMVFDEFNRMGGFDIADLSGGTVEPAKAPITEDLVSLNGIDTNFISVKKVYPSPRDATSADEKTSAPAKTLETTSSDDPPAKIEQTHGPKTTPRKPPSKPPAKPSGFKGLKKVSTLSNKANVFKKGLFGKIKTLGKKTGAPPSTDPQAAVKALSASRLKAGCVYSEINRIRENIVNVLEKTNDKTVAFITPHDDAGNTFLISLLGFNIAYFTKMKTLLVDLNMRRPQLHIPFGLEREEGFTEIVSGSLNWQDAVKDTGFSELKVVTAGRWDNELYLKITPDFIENMFQEMKAAYDLILMDSSPVLNKNRNNVDPVFLSFTCDMVVMVVQDKRTTAEQITESVEAITRDGGKIDGIVYNHQF